MTLKKTYCSLASLNLRSEDYIKFFLSHTHFYLQQRVHMLNVAFSWRHSRGTIKDDEVTGRPFKYPKHWMLNGTKTVISVRYIWLSPILKERCSQANPFSTGSQLKESYYPKQEADQCLGKHWLLSFIWINNKRWIWLTWLVCGTIRVEVVLLWLSPLHKGVISLRQLCYSSEKHTLLKEL